MTDLERLKPCPFCGFEVRMKERGLGISETCLGADDTRYYILCLCGARGPWRRTEEDAAWEWNKRSLTTNQLTPRKYPR